ncbi:UNVERIFIED_CONTAM: hypothetical protein Slati_1453100 [Sesamum latifolium]|uniref:DUF4218 domain-containing protein n=1 Tax=Sesamum latifolium TaxID=2727402 RepID=A0AAW2X870_9LAMI
MCMSSEYMFLTMVIPSLSNPKRLIDVYLESLIKELLQLWHVGVRTYDHATDNEFIMRTALMWTVNDLPAYGMTFGWSTAGVMGCPICMNDTRAFHLQHGRKACYFDCHRQFFPEQHPYQKNKKAFTKNRVENKTKKNIFWDLPYWSTLLIRHNLDVIHIKKNVFDNIFNMIMDIKEKTKDNLNARRDLKSICNHPELELDERRPNVMPKAAYTLLKEQKMREMLPEHVWSALTEVSLLFQSICSTMLDVHKLHELENSVSIILCNLEKIFPPAFFDSMEHLIVHLPYEARVGGPVQYSGCTHSKGSCTS